MTDVKVSGKAVEKVVLSVASFSMTGLVIGQGRHVHGGAHRLCGSYCGAQSKFQLQDFLQVFK